MVRLDLLGAQLSKENIMGKHARKSTFTFLTQKQKKTLTKEQLTKYEKTRALIREADKIERAYNVKPQAEREEAAARAERKKRWWQR